jgi:diguanylate cyclase (GGDEF)-like protein
MSSRFWMLPASIIATVLAKAVSTLHAPAALPFTILFMLISGIVGAALVRNREERRLQDALIDPLTGAFNRRHFQIALRIASERHERTSEPASLIVFDVDHFKAVNQTFGHTTGDAVLKTLVTIVARRIRLVDVVCRLGGDEFAVLLSNATAGDAVIVAEDLRALVEQTLVLNGRRVSISGGVSELKRGESTGCWLADADAALYQAKCGGRNRIAPAWSGRRRWPARTPAGAVRAHDRRDMTVQN